MFCVFLAVGSPPASSKFLPGRVTKEIMVVSLKENSGVTSRTLLNAVLLAGLPSISSYAVFRQPARNLAESQAGCFCQPRWDRLPRLFRPAMEPQRQAFDRGFASAPDSETLNLEVFEKRLSGRTAAERFPTQDLHRPPFLCVRSARLSDGFNKHTVNSASVYHRAPRSAMAPANPPQRDRWRPLRAEQR